MSIFLPHDMDIAAENQDTTSDQSDDDSYNDMPKGDKKSLMEDALKAPLPCAWIPSDGEGPADDQDAWKIIEPYIEDRPIPPKNVKLSDVQVFKILTNKSITIKDKHENWPFDFDGRGGILPGRRPASPTVFVQRGSKLYFLVFGQYYILCGTPCSSLKDWLCGVWTEGKWRNKGVPRWSYGLVEVPRTARTEPALVINLTKPTPEQAEIIEFKPPPPETDPSKYDWTSSCPLSRISKSTRNQRL